MKKTIQVLTIGLALAGFGGAAVAGEAPAGRQLSLSPAQALSMGEVTASGRIIPQFSAMVGSRLAAPIVTWGVSVNGAALDVGMPVTKGQVLFAVERSTFQAKLDTAKAAFSSAQAALDNLTAPTRKEQLDALRAKVTELDAKVKDFERDEARYKRLVNEDKTMPVKRLEEIQLALAIVQSQRQAAQATLDEAVAGPTPTEIAVAKARVAEAQTMVRAAEIDCADTDIRAPFDGVITKKMKGLGDYVAGAPFVEVLEVTSTDHLELELGLPEAYLPQVQEGKTEVTLRSSLLKQALTVPVSRVIPKVDAQQGTFVFRVAIPTDQRGGLLPGAFVTAALKLADRGDGVVVPQQAIISEGGKNYAMVAVAGHMVRREVEVSDRLTEGVILRSGVHPNEKVVMGPAELLKDGAELPAYLQEKPEQK